MLRNLLLFVAFVSLATFAAIKYIKVGSFTEDQRSGMRQLNTLKARPAAPQETPLETGARRIICPLCHGEKVIVVNTSVYETDDPLYRKTISCPVCLGVGYRMLIIPPGKKICPDCKGMGLVYFPVQPIEDIRTGYCARCSSTGLVVDLK
jgi:hypothetical protein